MDEWCAELEDCGHLAGLTPDQMWFLLPLVLLAFMAILWGSMQGGDA